jgi:hypothetical protein
LRRGLPAVFCAAASFAGFFPVIEGGASTTLNHVPVTMIGARIEPRASFRQHLPAGDNAFVMVLGELVSLAICIVRWPNISTA